MVWREERMGSEVIRGLNEGDELSAEFGRRVVGDEWR